MDTTYEFKKSSVSKSRRFKSTQRLLLPSEYKFVFNQSIRSSDKLLTILAKKNPHYEHSRLGLAIAKKSIKTAVHRNRIKRIIREYFRNNQNMISHADYVVLARKGIDQLDNKIIFQSLAKQFNYLRKQIKKKHNK